MSIRGLITLGLIEGVDEVITLGLDSLVVAPPSVLAREYHPLHATSNNRLHDTQANELHAHGQSELK